MLHFHCDNIYFFLVFAKHSSEHTALDILVRLNSRVNRDLPKILVNVTRENVLEGAIRAWRRRSFHPLTPLTVKFGGEMGIDNGGLTREFMQLAIKGIQASPIFVGPPLKRSLQVDISGKEWILLLEWQVTI